MIARVVVRKQANRQRKPFQDRQSQSLQIGKDPITYRSQAFFGATAWIAASQTRISMTSGIFSVLPPHRATLWLTCCTARSYTILKFRLKHQYSYPPHLISGILDLLQVNTDLCME
jgi:hypothetical protein